MPSTETFSKLRKDNRINGRRRSIRATEHITLGLAQDPERPLGLQGPILGVQWPSRSLPPARGAVTWFSLSSSLLGPHQPRCPPFQLQPLRQTRALSLPRKLPETIEHSSSPPSYFHSPGVAHFYDSKEPTSAQKGYFFRIPGDPAPLPDREPIKTALSTPGSAPRANACNVITARRTQASVGSTWHCFPSSLAFQLPEAYGGLRVVPEPAGSSGPTRAFASWSPRPALISWG